MRSFLKTALLVCAFSVLCQRAGADVFTDVTLDTAPLIGHPAGPFSLLFIFIDGSGAGDANNTATVGNVTFGGGSALGNPVTFGGGSGSLETAVSITDSSFINVFNEGFTPGSQLTFSLDVTSNDDTNGVPDRLTFSILDSSGVPVPTLAPFGDYFLGANLGATGPVFDTWGSDPSRALSIGGPVSISAPAINVTPEPQLMYLVGGALAATVIMKRLRRARRRA
jgi:hypothetical protein